MLNVTNELAISRKRLSRLIAKSNNAVSIVHSTISSLQDVNNSIDEELENISNIISDYKVITNDLNSRKGDNNKVIRNFKRLLEDEKDA